MSSLKFRSCVYSLKGINQRGLEQLFRALFDSITIGKTMALGSTWCESNPERMNGEKERPTFSQVEFQLGCVFHVFSFCIWAYKPLRLIYWL